MSTPRNGATGGGSRLDPETAARWRHRLPGCLASGAIIIAPFVGLLYRLDLALGIAVVALLVAVWLSYLGLRDVPPADHGRLRRLALLNLGLAVIAGAVLLARLAER